MKNPFNVLKISDELVSGLDEKRLRRIVDYMHKTLTGCPGEGNDHAKINEAYETLKDPGNFATYRGEICRIKRVERMSALYRRNSELKKVYKTQKQQNDGMRAEIKALSSELDFYKSKSGS